MGLRLPLTDPRGRDVGQDAASTRHSLDVIRRHLETSPVVTALPARPYDGQVVIYRVAEGLTWQFVYNEASGSSYKWEFVGGGKLKAIDATGETVGNGTTTGATYADPGGAPGPAVTVPLAGDYLVTYSALVQCGNTTTVFISPKNGAAATTDADSAREPIDTAGGAYFIGRPDLAMTITAASTVVKLQGRGSFVTDVTTYYDRQLNVVPLRVA